MTAMKLQRSSKVRQKNDEVISFDKLVKYMKPNI